MLVLSRRAGQGIMVGPDVEIVVLETDGSQVRLGIRAPREVSVLRCELLQQVRAENRRAAAPGTGGLELLGVLGAAPPSEPVSETTPWN